MKRERSVIDEKPAEKPLTIKSTQYDSVKAKVTEHMKVCIATNLSVFECIIMYF